MFVVTGGAGFIGSNLVASLEEKFPDYPVVVCDVLGKDEKWRNIAKRNLADIVAPEDLFAFLETHRDEIQAVFHLGAISSTVETDADLVVRANFSLSIDLLDWCTDYQVRLIYASSAATYGEGDQGWEASPTSSDLAKLRPLNVYGWSKHLFDRRVIDRFEKGATLPPQWAGLKFFNVYGPNEFHKEGQNSVALQIFHAIQRGETPKLFKSHRSDYADGEQIRDFVWVGDCVNVMIWLYQNPEVSGLYNVGSGKGRSFKDLAHAVFKALDQEPRIDYIDMPLHLREKYQYYTEASMKGLQARGYTSPLTALEEGVKTYVCDYLKTPDPYR